jgi:hypothetical protein
MQFFRRGPESRRGHKPSPDIDHHNFLPSPLGTAIPRRDILRLGLGATFLALASSGCSLLDNKKATEKSFLQYIAKYRPDLLAEMQEKLANGGMIEELDQSSGSGAERRNDSSDVFAGIITKRELSEPKVKELLKDPSSSITMVELEELSGSIIGPSNHSWYALKDQYPGYFGYKGFVCENKRYAQAQSIRALATVISYWHTLYGNNEIRLGHLTAAGHDSHRKGTSVDLNTYGDSVVNDGQPVAGHKLVPNYSQGRTIELAKLFAKLIDEKGRPMVKLIYFGTKFNENKDIYENVLRPDGIRIVFPWAGHDDHMHVEFYAYEDDREYTSAVFAPQC